jgi:N-acetylmannosamine-6-phosphate 2-epimerase/N-acetylmannosamine kinase
MPAPNDRSACLDRLRGRLVVSCQPVVGGPMDSAPFVAGLALAAIAGGAAGLRIEGLFNIRAVRAVTDFPVIGLIKRAEAGTEVFITPLPEDVTAICAAGADIVAFDATERKRPAPVAALVAAAHAAGALAMADLAAEADAAAALAAGVDILGTTLSGYTGGPVPQAPDFLLVAALARLGRPVFAEGRYRTPEQAGAAIAAGAMCVVVGSAITRVEHITQWFAEAVRAAGGAP